MIVEKILEATDFAYLAGLIDGEGSIVIYRRPPRKDKGATSKGDATPRYEMTISIGMTDSKIIYWLKDSFGGSAFEIKSIKEGRRRAWGWRLVGDKASELLKKILPYLKIKSAQAGIAIHFQDHLITKSRWQGQCIPQEDLALRDKFYEMNRMLNEGYNPEIEGGYGDS